MLSPPLSVWRTRAATPFTRTAPASIHCCRRLRETSASSCDSALSSLSPAALIGTVSVNGTSTASISSVAMSSTSFEMIMKPSI